MQRIDLAELEHTTQRRWVSGRGATIEIGTAGEKWFAWHSRKGAAWVYLFERSMCELAEQWLARGDWDEVPSADDARPAPTPRAHASTPTTATR